jgi:hypothetical protein
MHVKRQLFILGAGGLGREIEFCLDAILESDRDLELAGYLNDISDTLDDVPSDIKILGSITDYEFPENSLAIKSTVIPNKRVCDSVTIGVGSVVVRDIKDVCTVFGNPARRIK